MSREAGDLVDMLRDISGFLEVNVSVKDRQYRDRVAPEKLTALERSLKDEVGTEVVLSAAELDLEDRFKECAKSKDGAPTARFAEKWLSGILRSEATRRTRSIAGFFEEEEKGNEDLSTASFLLMGAPSRYAAVASRIVARQPVKRKEAVAWAWTTPKKDAKLTFRAVFLPGLEGDHLGGGDVVFPYLDHAQLGPDLDGEEEIIDDEIWSAPEAGTLYLVWDSVDEETVLDLKIAKCDADAATAARIAARDARQQRDPFGTLVQNSDGAVLVRVFFVPIKCPPQQQRKSKSITGLHIREKLRKTATRLTQSNNNTEAAPTEDYFSPETQRLSTARSRENSAETMMVVDQAQASDFYGALFSGHLPAGTTIDTELAKSLELAGQKLSALEDEAAICAARAERSEAALKMDKAKYDGEAFAWRKERAALQAMLKGAEERAARAEAKTNCAVTALKTLVDHELKAFVVLPEPEEEEEPSSSKNPFLGSFKDDDANRDWSRAECGDVAVDDAARAARRAADEAASTGDRRRASLRKVDKDRQRLTDEKRVLVAELRRLRSTVDDRIKAAKADADEARMIQRQLAAKLSKLKKTIKLHRSSEDDDPHVDDIVDDHDHLSQQRRQSDDASSIATTTISTIEDGPTTTTTTRGSPVEEPPAAVPYDHQHAEMSAQEKKRKRAELVAKLDGCRDRQRKLDALLRQNGDIANLRALKTKLDHAIITLGHQILALDGRHPDDGPPIVLQENEPSRDPKRISSPFAPPAPEMESPHQSMQQDYWYEDGVVL